MAADRIKQAEDRAAAEKAARDKAEAEAQAAKKAAEEAKSALQATSQDAGTKVGPCQTLISARRLMPAHPCALCINKHGDHVMILGLTWCGFASSRSKTPTSVPRRP